MKKWRRPGSIPGIGRARLALADLLRYPRLWWNLGLGRYNRMQAQGWWILLSTLAFVGIPLFVLGQLDLGGWWTSAEGIVLAIFLVMLIRWIVQTRGRVVVESFVDFTKEDAKAVSDLSTLLVTELGRLRELYRQINDLSIPTAVGVESHGGFGRAKEAGVFLTVSADDATDVLENAVASDAGISVGFAKVSLKPILTFVHRVTRGPRVVGSVHLTEAGGGPTLTAQYISRGKSMTWRIDQEREPVSPEQRKAFLDTMVRELACQMFSQLTLHGSVRWKAVSSFNEYLQLYEDARRTPRDRAHLLKEAQGELLEAVSEDEAFNLAYYNLGVIYTQLAHTERIAEERSEDATSRASFDRSELDTARGEAAKVAFERVVARNPDQWEAYYALAVTWFSEIPPLQLGEKPISEKEHDRRNGEMRAVISLCEQALAIAPRGHAALGAIYDLHGMAHTRLGDNFGRARQSHRQAVYHSRIESCQARRRAAARPDGLPDLVEHARANATGSLHNLALAYEYPASFEGGRWKRARARWFFRRARRLAGDGSAPAAAARFELGGSYERAGKFEKAAQQFKLASRIDTRSPEYHARCALAYAGKKQQLSGKGDEEGAESMRRKAHRYAHLSLDRLAQPFSLAVMPFVAKSLELRCRATLAALRKAFAALDDEEGGQWVHEIQALEAELRKTLIAEDAQTGKPCKPDDARDRADGLRARRGELSRDEEPAGIREGNGAAAAATTVPEETDPRTWQLDQVELAMGRLYADARAWPEATEVFASLVERLTREERMVRIVEFGAYAHLARAQRECREFVAALKTAALGIRRAPLAVEARREAGRAHFALGQFAEALDAWKFALSLSPSDPYLHYEIAMCHRELARDQTDEVERQRKLGEAKEHFAKAQELFDGEDLDGEAWTRFWRGKIAFEAGDPMEGLEYLKGAEHGTARAAAALLLGESHLRLDQRPAADHAFKRCEEALEGRIDGSGTDAKTMSRLDGRTTIDALWGDELPVIAVLARIACGKAEAQFLSPGDWQNSDKIKKAYAYLQWAQRRLEELERPEAADICDHAGARDEVRIRLIETESRLFQALGDVEEALEKVRERLRYKKTEEALRLEAELLELSITNGGKLEDHTRRRLAAKHVKQSLSGDGRDSRR